MLNQHTSPAMPACYSVKAQILNVKVLGSRRLRGVLVFLTELVTQTESSAQHDALTSRIERIKNLLEEKKSV